MPTVTPYVMVDSAKVFRKFIEDAFDAEVSTLTPLDSDPERVIHAEARIGESTLFFADSGPDGGRCLRSPHRARAHPAVDHRAGRRRRLRAGDRGRRPLRHGGERPGGRQPGGRLRRPVRHTVVGQHTLLRTRAERGGACPRFGFWSWARYGAAAGCTATRSAATWSHGEPPDGRARPRARPTPR